MGGPRSRRAVHALLSEMRGFSGIPDRDLCSSSRSHPYRLGVLRVRTLRYFRYLNRRVGEPKRRARLVRRAIACCSKVRHSDGMQPTPPSYAGAPATGSSKVPAGAAHDSHSMQIFFRGHEHGFAPRDAGFRRERRDPGQKPVGRETGRRVGLTVGWRLRTGIRSAQLECPMPLIDEWRNETQDDPAAL